MGRNEFILTDDSIVSVNDIKHIYVGNIRNLKIKVVTDSRAYDVTGIRAIEVIKLIKPSALEGEPKLKWIKNSWFIHNVIGHPVMQLLASLGFSKAGIWVHDATVPPVEKLDRNRMP